jgi:Cu+-exporting ATPase
MGRPDGSTRLDLRIDGMHCAGCVSTIENALRALPGVTDPTVNLATGSAAVTLQPAAVGTADVLDAIRRAGYAATIPESPQQAVAERVAARRSQIRAQLGGLFAAAVLALPILLAHMFPGPALLHRFAHTRAGWLAQALLCAAVIAIGAGGMLRGAWTAVRNRAGSMDLLVSLGLLVSFVAGLVGIALGIHELILFESAVMIVLFVSLGKLLEALARARASATLETLLMRLPRTALRVSGDRLQAVPIDDIALDDVLRIAAPATLPVDGVIVSGSLALDEAMLTGESLPVQRGVGDAVLGGTIAASGSADIRATSTGATCAAARIARLVEQAQATKAPAQRLADRAAAIFVPVVLTLAILTAIGWILAGSGVTASLTRAVAVLVIACPCAMGLAIPTAVLVGTSAAGARGILIRNVEALESAATVDLVLLDKTGTLTAGAPTVRSVRLAPTHSEHELLAIAVGAAAGSTHPLSQAIVRYAQKLGIEARAARRHESFAGSGIAAEIDGREALFGSAAWLHSRHVELPGSASADIGTNSIAHGALDGRWIGSIELADELLPEAHLAVRTLQELRVETIILSGDRAPAVASVADSLGIAFRAALSPAEKLRAVQDAVRSGRRVAMVGDGINDAPALAAATIGIAIGAGADVASEAADVVLLGRSPRLIGETIQVSRTTVRIMKQNLIWAAGYNLVMLPLAALAPLSPGLATAAMMLSSLSVVGNSLRLRRAPRAAP